MIGLYHSVIDGLGMLAELVLFIVVPIFNWKCGKRNCICFKAMKHIEHGMKVLETELDKWVHRKVTINEIQRTIDAMFMLRILQEEYRAKG